MARTITTLTHESPLGNWRISLCTPHPALVPLVANLWFGEGSVSYQRDRILPSGQSQLLINLGPTQYRIETGPPERRVPFRDVWYSALHQGPIDTEAPHGNILLGVTFRSHGTYPWLGETLADLAGQVVPLADIIGNDVLALRERLLNCPSLEGRFDQVQDWIVGRLSATRAVHPAVQWMIDRLAASGGRESVDALARSAGYSRKHVAHLFERQIGMGPKALARVLRFRKALGLLQGNHPPTWAALAHQCGYYDQAHLSNEFRRLTGLSPREFAHKPQPDDQSIVLL